jgi:hypothetical protein
MPSIAGMSGTRVSARAQQQEGLFVPDSAMMPSCSGPSRCDLETVVFVLLTERRSILTAPARVGSCALWSGRKEAFGEVEQKE